MASWADIIPIIADRLQTVNSGLTVVAYYSDSLTVGVDGVAEIGPRSGENEINTEKAITAGNVYVHYGTVTLYVACNVEDVAQNLMQRYMSPGDAYSVADALWVLWPELATVAEKIILSPSRGYGKILRANEILFTNSWDFAVWAAAGT